MHNALQETLFFYKFFLKTHQQNLNFSPYYRGVFFCCGKIKCNQGVKNFDEMPVMLSVNQAAEVLGIIYDIINTKKDVETWSLANINLSEN